MELRGILLRRMRWLGAVRVFSIIISIITFLVLPSFLGVESYSRYVYYLALIAIPFQFTGMGIEQAIQRYILKYRTKNELGSIKSLFTFTILIEFISIMLVFFGYLIAFFIKPSAFDFSLLFVGLVVVAIFARMVSMVTYQLELGFERFDLSIWYSAPTELVYLLFVLVGYYFFQFPGVLFAIALAYVVTSGVGATINMYRFSKREIFRAQPISISRKELFSYGFPIYLGSSLSKMAPSFGVIALSFFFGKTVPQIAFFSLAVGMVTVLHLVINTILASLYPEIVKAEELGKRGLFDQLLNRLFTYVFIVGVASYFSVLYLGPYLFSFFLPDYQDAMLFFPLVGIVLFVLPLQRLYERIAMAEGITSTYLEQGALLILLYATLYPLMIWASNSYGVAFAYTIIVVMGGIFFIYRTKKKSKGELTWKKHMHLFAATLPLFLPLLFSGYLQLIMFVLLGLIWSIYIFSFLLSSKERELLFELLFIKSLIKKAIKK